MLFTGVVLVWQYLVCQCFCFLTFWSSMFQPVKVFLVWIFQSVDTPECRHVDLLTFGSVEVCFGFGSMFQFVVLFINLHHNKGSPSGTCCTSAFAMQICGLYCLHKLVLCVFFVIRVILDLLKCKIVPSRWFAVLRFRDYILITIGMNINASLSHIFLITWN